MKKFRVLAAAFSSLAIFSAPSLLRAADPSLDSAFTATISPGLTPDGYVAPPASPSFGSGTGAVNAVALQSDGKIIAGGNISRYKAPPAGSPQTSLKRLLPDGTLDTAFDVFASTLAVSQGQTEVNKIITVAGDKLYVGGVFTSYQGVARSGVMRLNADGSLDTGFDAAGVSNTNPFGSRYVLALAEQPDGKVLVGGFFNRANGVFRPSLARFNADGTLDTGFNPFPALPTDASAHDIALLPDGQILVAGGKPRAGGGYVPLLVRLNSDGSLDPSFSTSFADAFGDIDELLLMPDGRIIIGGDFDITGSGSGYNIAGLLPNGAIDSTFLTNLGSGPNGWVGGELVLQPDGTILAGGIFTSWDNQPRASIARLRPDGTLDPDLAVLPYVPTTEIGYMAHLYSFAVQPDGKIVAGGWFARLTDPALETYNLTRINNEFSPTSPGTLRLVSTAVSTAENAGSVTLQVSRFSGLVGAVTVNYSVLTGGADGTATAGADFTAVSGTLSWANGEGGFKTLTVPLLQDTTNEGNETFTVVLSGVTGGATLPVGSSRATVTIRDDDAGPVITQHPAAVSLEQGANFTLSVRYNSVLPATIQWQRDPDGDGPLTFADIPGATGVNYSVTVANPDTHAGVYRAIVTNQPNGTPASATSNPATVSISVPAGSVVATFAPSDIGAVTAAAPDSSGRILALTTTGLRRLAADGTVEATTSFGVSLANSTGFALLPLSDGRVLVGGSFTSQTHQPSSATSSISRLFRVNADATGTIDTSYTPTIPGPVNVLAAGASGKFYVGSTVTIAVNGAIGVQRYLASGAIDPTFAAPTFAASGSYTVHAIRELSPTQILVAYTFSAGGFGGAINYNVARFNVAAASPYAATLDPTFGTGGVTSMTFTPRALDVLPDGRIALAGSFATVAGVAQQFVGLLLPNGAPDSTFLFSGVLNSNANGIAYRDGRLLVWGPFTTVNGATQGNLVRVNLDGSVDPTFSIGAGASGSFGFTINTAFYTSGGDIFIGGSFTSFKSVGRNRMALLAGNGNISAIGFVPPRVTSVEAGAPLNLNLRRYGSATEAVSITYATADAASGTSATSGADYMGATGTVSWAAGDSADKTVAIQILADATQEPTEIFRVLLSGPTGPAGVAASATVTLIDSDTPLTYTAQPTGSALIVGGNLALAATTTSPSPTTYQWFRNGLALAGATSANFAKTGVTLADAGVYTLVSTNAAGAVASTPVLVAIRPKPGALFAGQAANGRPLFNSAPQAIVALPDGGALIGGSFTTGSGSQNINQPYLVRVRPDGGTDTSFSLPLNNSVTALLRQPDGKILVGGIFTAITGNATAINTFIRLNADLTLDSAFSGNVGASSFGEIGDFALDASGNIYVGVGNTTGGLFRFAATGVRDLTYAPAVNQAVRALSIQPLDNKLLVAGFFSSLAGSSATRFGRLLPDGTRDTGFTPAIGNSTPNDLLVLKDNRIIIAGSLSSTSMLQIADNGSTLSNMGSGNQVYELSEGPGGTIVVVRTGSGPVYRLKGTNPFPIPGSSDGDATFSATPDSDVTTVTHADDGSIWIAGPFANVNSTATNGVARLYGDPLVGAIINPPANTGVAAGATAYFGVGAHGTGLTYQWFKDGAPLSDAGNISGATTAILSITGASAADQAAYTVAVTGGTPSATRTSGPARLYVLGAPAIATPPAAVSVYVADNFTVSAEIFAQAPATFTWRRDGVTLADGGRISGATTASLAIAGALESDSGNYTLTVVNGLGQVVTTPVFVLVAPKPDSRAATHGTLAASQTVKTLLPLPDGRMLVAGTAFTNFTGGAGSTSATGTAVALANPDGTLALPGSAALTLDAGATINAIVRLSNGKYLVGGSFTNIGGLARPRVARLNADFTVDATFNAGTTLTSASFVVYTLAVDNTGRIYAGGNFNSWGGVAQTVGGAARNYLVRLSADGAFDDTFTTQFNNSVNKLLTLADGRVVVGGNFTSPKNYLAALDTSGALASAFTPAATNTVNDLALNPAGDRFYAALGSSPFIRRFDLTGATDSAFSPIILNSGSVLRLAVQPDGKVIAFGNIFGPGSGAPYHFVRLSATGVNDASFAPNTVNYSLGSSTEGALAVDVAGRVWLGGAFTSSTFPGGSATRLLVLAGDTPALALDRQPVARSVDIGGSTTFTASVRASSSVTWQWFRNGVPLTNGGRISGATTSSLTVTGLIEADEALYTATATNPASASVTTQPAALIVLATPEILSSPAAQTAEVGVAFTATATARGAGTLSYQWFRGTAGTPVADIVGATSATYTINLPTLSDTSYYGVRVTNSLGSVSSSPVLITFAVYAGTAATATLPTFNNTVNKVIPLADGSFFAAGQFTTVTPFGGFSSTRRGIARIFANGSVDTAFIYVNNTSVTVSDAVRDSQGRFVFAGNYNTVLSGGNNVTRNSLARTTSAGALDTGFNSPLTSALSNISVLALDASDGVYVGGFFSGFAGVSGANFLVRLDPTTGALDTAFTAAVPSQVSAIHVLANGQLLVGGSFGIRRLNANGTHDATFVYTGALSITAILPVTGSTDFLLGGTTGSPQRITATGTVVAPWPASGTGADSGVNRLLALSDGRTLVGGSFNNYNSVSSAKIALIEANGTRSTAFTFGAGFNNNVNDLALDSTGRIFVAGQFTTYRGVAANRIVILNPTDTIPADPGAPAASPFAAYLATANVPANQRAATDDPDGDGISNLLEFALGLNPSLADANGLPIVAQVGGNLTLTYDRAQPANVTYLVKTTTDVTAPGSWTATGVAQGTPAGDGITTASVAIDGTRRFLRLEVELIAP